MKRILVRLKERSYPILIGRNLVASVGSFLKPLKLGPKILIVTNEAVSNLFLASVLSSLKRAGFELAAPYLLEHGDERDKSEKTLLRLWEHMARAKLERTSTLLALGGGVVGDVAGFAASTYMRGISLVLVPTTLLAQVDASIGGKTGIDLPSAKNLVGTFYQPRMVISDVGTLQKIPTRELRNGFAEIIKYGMIRDAALFRLLEREKNWFEPDFLETVIARSAAVKAEIIERDERETKGERIILNYGHTFAHAFEAASQYRLPHGEAVALGMVSAARLARKKKLLRASDEERQNRLIEKAGLPTERARYRLGHHGILQHMMLDKKKREGKPRFVLPSAVGCVKVVENVSLAELKEIL